MGHYERLSAQDAFFLALEDTNSTALGAVLIFDALRFRGRRRMDIDRVRQAIESKLEFVPASAALAHVPYEKPPL